MGDNGYCEYPYSEWGSHWEVYGRALMKKVVNYLEE